MYSSANDQSCPKCRSWDKVSMAVSHPERFEIPREPAQEPLVVPYGAVMLAYLLASLPFLAGSLYERLSNWPSALLVMNDYLPKPLLTAAIGAAILLIAMDRPTRLFLLNLGRAAALHPRIYRVFDAGASSPIPKAFPAGVAIFGWAVFLGLRSLDTWLEMAVARAAPGPEWLSVAAEAALTGGLVALAGVPLMAFIMTRMAHSLDEFELMGRNAASFEDFARGLAYPFVLLPAGIGLAVSSGQLVLIPLAVCWFVAAVFAATRQITRQDTETVLPVTLLGATPVILAFFVVTLWVQMNVVDSDWDSFPGQVPALPDLQLAWIAGAASLALVLAIAAVLLATLTRRYIGWTANASRREGVQWQRLLYCERCDGVHLPNQQAFTPASDVSILLIRGGN